MNCDPNDLLEAAACMDCLTESQLDVLELYLLCLIYSAQ